MSTAITVRGEIQPEDMGLILVHEHVMSTFGADPVRYANYDVEALLAAAVPYLKRLRSLGCQTIVDATAAYFGRHPELLREISIQSGVHILTNTGYYAAADDRYVPKHAYTESVSKVAERWIREYRESIDETGIRPGFIKTAVDSGSLSDIDEKLLRAAILTHMATGLPIQTHLGDNSKVARFILALLRAEGTSATGWIWVHAHSVENPNDLIHACDQGAWISLDGLSGGSSERILALVLALRQKGYLNRVLLSHDGEAYDLRGGARPFEFLLTDFLPQLKSRGLAGEEIDQLTIHNPRDAFTIARDNK